VAQKVDIFGKFGKLQPRDQFGLATPALETRRISFNIAKENSPNLSAGHPSKQVK
jgi:hypothetical protein